MKTAEQAGTPVPSAPLRLHIEHAWRTSIERDYRRQRINSERSLQASLWATLNAELPSDSHRMFIEPSIRLPGGNRAGLPSSENRCPDIVICDRSHVIGIIEVKYQPRALPSWRKDLSTFEWLLAHRTAISIANVRYRGVQKDATEYRIADDVLFAWAGVHTRCDKCVAPDLSPELRLRFMALHAETTVDEHPSIRIESLGS